MTRQLTIIVRWTITALYAMLVLYISTRSFGGLPPFPHFDKLVHFSMYAGLGFLCAWSLRAVVQMSRARVAWISVLLATAYGTATEVVQLYLPTRSMELGDIAANAAGAVAGALIAVRLAGGCARTEARGEGAG